MSNPNEILTPYTGLDAMYIADPVWPMSDVDMEWFCRRLRMTFDDDYRKEQLSIRWLEDEIKCVGKIIYGVDLC
jgi:hypothetical protein